MIEKCRELCRKYTDLSEEEIDCIIEHLGKLQEIADKKNSNVFIDCLTYHPQSAIIVNETFPQNGASIYPALISGKVIKIYNEPAVERGFSLGVPTEGVTAIEVPGTKDVIQSAYPIVYKGKVIAMIILEKKIEEYGSSREEKSDWVGLDYSVEYILEQIPEPVIVVEESGTVVYCNQPATELYALLGYVDPIPGMKSDNIIASLEHERYQFQMRGRTIEMKKFKLMDNSSLVGVMLKDITESEKIKKSNSSLLTEYRELVHSVKNSLFLLKGICEQKQEQSIHESIEGAYEEMSGLISSLAMVMELKLNSGQERMDIRTILSELAERIIELNTGTNKKISIEVTGDDIQFNSGETNAIVVVVYELICNALKYAFIHKDSGHIQIMVKRKEFFSQIMVTDNGCGFEVDTAFKKSNGLKLINTIVRERLNGRMVVCSSENGTNVSFDIC